MQLFFAPPPYSSKHCMHVTGWASQPKTPPHFWGIEVRVTCSYSYEHMCYNHALLFATGTLGPLFCVLSLCDLWEQSSQPHTFINSSHQCSTPMLWLQVTGVMTLHWLCLEGTNEADFRSSLNDNTHFTITVTRSSQFQHFQWLTWE